MKEKEKMKSWFDDNQAMSMKEWIQERDVWYNVEITRTAEVGKLYIDGVLQEPKPKPYLCLSV